MKLLPILLAVTAFLAGCAGAPFQSSSPLNSPPHIARTVEYTTIASDSDESARAVASYFGGSAPESNISIRTPVRSARVKSAELITTAAGDPVLHVELNDSDKLAFHAFTTEHLDQPLVVLVQDRYVLYAHLMDPLPGRFAIWGCTMEEAKALEDWFGE